MKRKRIRHDRVFILIAWIITIILLPNTINKIFYLQKIKQVDVIKEAVIVTSSTEETIEEQESYRSRLCGLESVTCKEEIIEEAIKTDLDIIKDLSAKYDVDWKLIESIVIHETGKRTSRVYKELNNPGGMMKWSTELNAMVFLKFNNLEEAYDYMIKNIKNNYINKGLTTIESIGKKYCPVGTNDNGTNQYWIPKVKEIYNSLI